ncbi:hypothetical protein ACUXV3_00600 [Roseobacteraceae bacterium NS-SX3]
MRLSLIPLLAALTLPAVPGAAQTMNGEQFDRYTQGRTLFYGFDGTAYGVERYLPGRRVIWSFLDGKCQEGIWYEEAGQICFLYEDRSDPQCWSFSLTPDGLTARFENDPEATELYEAEDIGEEMICHGPDVGV